MTLYEILEVSEKASNEIIEKAYKVLAKKYHPDLQEPQNRSQAEEKMKKINEAYDVLINPQKRQAYDEKLRQKRLQEDQAKSINIQYNNRGVNNNVPPQNNTYEANYSHNYNQNHSQASNKEEFKVSDKTKKEIEKEIKKKYINAYDEYLRSLGYRVKTKWTWKRVKDLLITILIMLGIVGILWIFPPTHKLIISFYEDNIIIKTLVDAIINALKVKSKT